MRRMDQPEATGTTSTTGANPTADHGERRLDRPPSDRYHPTEMAGNAPPAAAAGATLARGIAFSVVTAIVVGLVITVLGGVLLVSAGLVVIALAGGWAVANALRTGAGAALGRDRRRWLAIGLALVAVALGQLGLWLLARNEGGVLSLVDYLAQTFGILVPLQALAAILAAGWTAR